jgi:hypothetical protein
LAALKYYQILVNVDLQTKPAPLDLPLFCQQARASSCYRECCGRNEHTPVLWENRYLNNTAPVDTDKKVGTGLRKKCCVHGNVENFSIWHTLSHLGTTFWSLSALKKDSAAWTAPLGDTDPAGTTWTHNAF